MPLLYDILYYTDIITYIYDVGKREHERPYMYTSAVDGASRIGIYRRPLIN